MKTMSGSTGAMIPASCSRRTNRRVGQRMKLNQRVVFLGIAVSALLAAGGVVAYQEYKAQQQEKLEALHCNACDARKQKQVQARESNIENGVVENPEQQ